MALDKLKSLFCALKTDWEKESKDLRKIQRSIDEIQEFCAENADNLKNTKDSQSLFIMQRKICEVLVMLLCLNRDTVRFPEAMAELGHYYDSKIAGDIPQSEMHYELVGLHLMYLLAQNKLSEFSIESARIPTQVRNENPYISLPIQLEQYMNVGLYNKRNWEVKNNVFHFSVEKEEEQVINTMPMIAQLIDYAKHLEMIV